MSLVYMIVLYTSVFDFLFEAVSSRFLLYFSSKVNVKRIQGHDTPHVSMTH